MGEHEDSASAKTSTPPKAVTLDDVLRVQKQILKEVSGIGERLDALFLRVGQSKKREVAMSQKFDDAYAIVSQELDETQAKVEAIGNVVEGGIATIQSLAAAQAATQAMLDEALKGVNLTADQEAKFAAVKARNDAFQQALNDKAVAMANAIASNTSSTSTETPGGTVDTTTPGGGK